MATGQVDEQGFQNWYAERARQLGLSSNPDDPEHFYDYRAAFKSGAEPDASGHWPSQFKREGHPRQFLPVGAGGQMVDTRTMQPMPGPVDLPPGYRPEDVLPQQAQQPQQDLPPGYSAADVVAPPLRELAKQRLAGLQAQPPPEEKPGLLETYGKKIAGYATGMAGIVNKAVGWDPNQVGSATLFPLDQGQTVSPDPVGAATDVAHMVYDPVLHPIYKAGEAYGQEDYPTMVRHGAEAIGAGAGLATGTLSGAMMGPAEQGFTESMMAGKPAEAFGGLAADITMAKAPEITAAVKGGARAVAGKAAPAADWLSDRLYRSTVKPGGRDIGKINKAMEFGRAEGIEPTEAGASKLEALTDQIGAEIGAVIKKAPKKRTIRTQPIADAIADLRQNLLPSEQGAVDAAAGDIFAGLQKKNGTYRDMTPQEAFKLRVKLQRAAVRAKKSAYAGGSANPAGNAPGVEAWQTGAGNIGEQIVAQFPEIADKNARYSAGMALDPMIDAAAVRISKHEPFGLLPTLGAVGGAVVHGLPGGAAGLILTRILTDPILRAKTAIAISKASGGVVSRVQATSRLKAMAAAPAQQPSPAPAAAPAGPKPAPAMPTEPNVAARAGYGPQAEAPAVGLAIKHVKSEHPEGGGTPGTPFPEIPTTKKEIIAMAAAAIKDGNLDSPARLDHAMTAVVGDEWHKFSDNKGGFLDKNETFTKANQFQKVQDARAFTGEVPTPEEFRGRTTKGRALEKWYREGIKEWADEIGHEEAIKILDAMATASPQIPVPRAALEGMRGFFEHKLGRTDWSERVPSIDPATGQQRMVKGQPQTTYKQLSGVQNRKAVIDVLNGLAKPSGPKVGPFAAWSKYVLTGESPGIPNLDTHSIYSAIARRNNISVADRAYADMRHRIEAHRLGLSLDEMQASNWSGRNREIAAMEGPGAQVAEELPEGLAAQNARLNYSDVIRDAERQLEEQGYETRPNKYAGMGVREAAAAGKVFGRPGGGPVTTYRELMGGKTRELQSRSMDPVGGPGEVGPLYQRYEYVPVKPMEAPLSAAERSAETRAINQLKGDRQGHVDKYREKNTKENGQVVVNTDEARDLFPDYHPEGVDEVRLPSGETVVPEPLKLARSQHSASVHEASSAVTKDVFNQLLQEEAAPPGLRNEVTAMAGGSGTGKTTAVQNMGLGGRSQFLWDTNLHDPVKGIARIKQMLEAGKNVNIVGVYREIFEAWRDGALKRAERSGRNIKVDTHYETNAGFPSSFLQMREYFKNDPRVKFRLIDNSRGLGRQVLVPDAAIGDFLGKIKYNEADVKAGLEAELVNQAQTGRISPRVVEGSTSAVLQRTEGAGSGRGRPASAGSPPRHQEVAGPQVPRETTGKYRKHPDPQFAGG